MTTSLVLTVLGKDRPGLVGLLSEAIARHGGNWEASRMARLAGQFAGLLRVSVPASASEPLLADLRLLEARGLQVTVTPGGDDPAPAEYRMLTLEVVGQDHPGIVAAIAGALAARGVNVEELSTEVRSAPMFGGALFTTVATLRAPMDLATDELEATLEALAADLMVDIEVGEAAAADDLEDLEELDPDAEDEDEDADHDSEDQD